MGDAGQILAAVIKLRKLKCLFVVCQLYLTVTFLRRRNLRNALKAQPIPVESVTTPYKSKNLGNSLGSYCNKVLNDMQFFIDHAFLLE